MLSLWRIDLSIRQRALNLDLASDGRPVYAVKVAAATRRAIESGNKRGGSESAWRKVKFDRQIIAIAKVEGASTIYSDDEDIGRFSKNFGLTVIRVRDLPLPPVVKRVVTTNDQQRLSLSDDSQ